MTVTFCTVLFIFPANTDLSMVRAQSKVYNYFISVVIYQKSLNFHSTFLTDCDRLAYANFASNL